MKAAWNDLALLLADGIRRWPKTARAWAFVAQFLLLPAFLVSPFIAAGGGCVIGISLVSERRSPLKYAAGFSVLSVALLLLLNTSHETLFSDDPNGLIGLAVGLVMLVAPFLAGLGAVDPPRGVARFLGGALGTAIVFVTVLGLIHLGRSTGRQAGWDVLGFGSAVAFGTFAVVHGRTRAGGALLFVAAAVLMEGGVTTSSVAWHGALVGVFMPLSFLFACAARAPQPLQRPQDALGRWVRRIQDRPWATSIRVVVLADLLRWALTLSVVHGAPFGSFPGPQHGLTVLALIFVGPPLLGACLGHVLRAPRNSLDRLAPLAATAACLGLIDVGFHEMLLPTSGVVSISVPFVILVGAVPAAVAASVRAPRWMTSSQIGVPVAFGLTVLSIVFGAREPVVFVVSLAVLGIVFRAALVRRPSLRLMLVFTLAGAVSGRLLADSLATDTSLSGAVLPASVFLLLAAWPCLAVARLFGGATAVPREHPIYVDFGGPVENTAASEAA